MKILREISISVNARNLCTGEVTRLTQNHNRCCALATKHRAVHCGESNRLGPPVGVGAAREKSIDQRVIEFTGADQVTTQFSNRFNPVVRPQRAAIVNRGFGCASDLC